ncbi:MAG: hypothetical protein RBT76_10780 [candidate division Zixibacteria bacterium]|jgi:hypothetical protein|nr:hypothetical protein [candidate division Zixibacteria bacterium]
MPTLFGDVYPEITNAGPIQRLYAVLVDARMDLLLADRLIRQLSLIRYYWQTSDHNSAILNVYWSNLSIPTILRGYNMVPLCEELELRADEERLRTVSLKHDLDCICTLDDSVLELSERVEKSCGTAVKNCAGLMEEVELFSRGMDLPWSMGKPVFNMPWTGFHSMLHDSARPFSEAFVEVWSRKGLPVNTLETCRSLLLNRIAETVFLHDRLLFLRIQRRKSKRKGWERQKFIFECSLFLSAYYHQIWGGIEQLSRLIKDILGMRINNKVTISLGNPKFRAKVIAVHRDLGQVFVEERFIKWIDHLKVCRDYIAHQGTIVLRPLAEKLDSPPTRESLVEEVLQSEKWKRVASHTPEYHHAGILDQWVNVLFHDKHKMLRDDALILFHEEGRSLLFPLDAIEWNLDNYLHYLRISLELLLEPRQRG